MFGLRRFSCAGVLVFGVIISLSHSQDGVGFFTKLYQQATSLSSPYVNQPPAQRSAWAGAANSKLAITTNSKKIKTDKFSSRSTSVHEKPAASSKAAVQGRSHSSGWGWDEGHGGWGHQHVKTQYIPVPSQDKGFINPLIAGLAGLGLLALLASGFLNRRTAQTVAFVNSSGRRRRAVRDMEDDDVQGESLPQVMSLIGNYIHSAWTGSSGKKPLELFNLPQLD